MHLTVHHLVQVKTQLQHTLPVTTNHATKLDTVAAASASSAAIVIAIVIAIVSAIVSAIADSIVTAGSIASLTITAFGTSWLTLADLLLLHLFCSILSR